MRSWDLEKFVTEHGWFKAHQIWGKSRQAIFKAIGDGRCIRVLELKSTYEMHESKKLASVPLKSINLDDRRMVEDKCQ